MCGVWSVVPEYACIYPSILLFLSFFLSLPAHRSLCQYGAQSYGGHSNRSHREEISKLIFLIPLSLSPFLILLLLFPGSTLHLCHTPKCHKTLPFTGGTFLATGQVVLGNHLGRKRQAAFLKTCLTQRDNRVIAVHTHTHTRHVSKQEKERRIRGARERNCKN